MHSEQENNSFPAEFLERMKEMLGEEYPAFFESLGQERQQSFRVNTGKTRIFTTDRLEAKTGSMV